MTTTELIEILRKNEFGGASGRPREVSFCAGDRIISTDGIEVTGSGDGLITELDLSLPDAEPTAPPEIIRCRNCKYAEIADPEDNQDGYTCQFHRGSIWFSDSYCSWAERR